MEAAHSMTDVSGRSTPHDVPIRSAPSTSSRTFEGSVRSSNVHPNRDTSHPTPSETWAGAISRVQTQVSLNTSLLDSHRSKVQDIEIAINRLDQAVGNAMAVLHDVRSEQRARPTMEPTRHDPDDLLVLAERVGAISNRVNEVDALRMQVKLLENRIKRWEEQGPPSVANTRSESGSVMRDPSYRESQVPSQYSLPSHPPSVPSQHQPLPPIRTSANMSPVDNRPIMRSSSSLHQPSMDSSATMQASSSGGFRLGEPLPPPSAITGWHTGESHVPSGPLPPPPQPGPSRQQPAYQETQASGWAAVNAPQTAKRPYEEPRQSPYQSSVPGSPKRPRLAPIMPRTQYSEESAYVPSSVPNSTAPDSYRTHSRAPSDASQCSIMVNLTHTAGLTLMVQAGVAEEVAVADEAAEVVEAVFSSQRMILPQSPEDVSRGGIVRRAGGAVGGPSDRESEIPATPLASSGPYDPFAAGMGDQGSAGKKSRSKPFRNAEGVLIRKDGRPDMRSVSSANNLRKVHAKKEAERAEMEGRTPTSARSLVPAGSISDDEEGDESLPGSPEGQGQGGEEGGDPSDTQERHRELMSRIFPSGVEDASRSVGERFFPTQEQRVASEAVMKKEPSSEEPLQTEEGHGTEASSQMTDVVMREMSEAQTEDQQRRAEREDTRMATVEEANEEQEQDQREG
ncbi:hypothetical protein LTR09_005652 [Extremus antarcticus]|uniref:Uncharacterized protein n=1 Tax=Extremus antarcticus TaxID=702011 RepID=A0AAJ0DMV3_9PEZI|nr:hypothetical protein LTR09_005652 [Extremus antarcticus]